MKDFNVMIIGSGPAGLFAAIRLERLGVDRIAIFDRNKYPAGGLLNDGKLNFDYRVGIDLDELQIGRVEAQDLMHEVRQVFVKFPRCQQVTFIENNEKIDAWKKIADEHSVQFIAPEQWHYGTDNGKQLVNYLRSLLQHTTFFLGTEVVSIEKENGKYRFVCRKNRKTEKYSGKVVLASPGRGGAYWFRDSSKKTGVNNNFGPIDVGIRIELNRKFYDSITDVVYDPKFIFRTKRHDDRVRTFCTNPGGRVRIENYGDFKLVNGDALFDRKTKNTNFALINTVSLTQPFSDTTEFGQMIARQFFLLGGGRPIVQRVGDFREGKRSSKSTFNSKTRHFDRCKATYNAVPGDITLGLPARIVDNLWESLKTLDKIVPGILHPSTLLYAPEIKFFDTHFPTDQHLETNIDGIFVAGDGTGKSRGIVGAAVSGIIAAKGISEKYF
ncbi:MAG: FAD-dependent oxidoreductase [Thermodesulfobacteriota bacterium]|nr:FAD-dependent oxidoreductase [Thermodesulfobacteriota bacterium]